MRAGIVRFPRTSQPQGPAQLNWSNPLTRNLQIAVCNSGGTLREMVSGRFPSGKESAARVTTKGVAEDFNNTRVIFQHSRTDDVLGAITVATLVFVDALTNYSAVISKNGSGVDNMPFEFRLSGGPSDGSIDFLRANADYRSWNARDTSIGSLINTNAFNFAAVTADAEISNRPVFFINGSEFLGTDSAGNPAGSGTGTGTATSTQGELYVGKRFDGVTYLDGAMLLTLVWARRLSINELRTVSNNPWQLFAPLEKRIWAPVSAGGGGLSLALTGSAATSSVGTELVGIALALAGSASASAAGTLAPSAAVALAGASATSAAGTVAPNLTIALAGTQAASAAGTITYSSGADVTVTLSGQSATSAAGTLGNSASIALAGYLAAATAGTLTASGGVQVVVASTTAAGRPARKRTRNYVVEIDGEDFIVSSQAEARALLDKVQEDAAQVAKVAVERAAKASKKPIRKVLHDARKALQVPQITAPKALAPISKQALTSVEGLYASTMRDIEIAALLRRAAMAEEDDEDVLMLMA